MIGDQEESPDAASELGNLPTKRNGCATSTCPAAWARLKPQASSLGVPMLAILMIVVFIVVMGALNLYEFGRLD
ncbi:hypothetical protein [Phenylobacterium sp.]|uniref:hypothetical protein n=1 Tax=Phenylobacterium sp. TaxID=1871053 RepID=UPI0025D14548|nr:hypothetical protein [Phenylobacterium sp.]